MASRAATWVAFRAIFKRGLTTATPTRFCPRQPNFLPPHQALYCEATKGQRIPQTHFTSKTRLRQDGIEEKQSAPKRKPASRNAEKTSLRRVAVEAQRSRGTLIRGKGRTRHVDPEVETKDVTAYCAAETYDIHLARDLLQAEGFLPDPSRTALFPQVLHVQTPSKSTHVQDADSDVMDGPGDVFIFPSGSVVTWNVTGQLAHNIVEKVLLPAAENSHVAQLEAEDLEYVEDPTRESSTILGDTIVLGTKELEMSSHHSDLTLSDAASNGALEGQHDVDNVLTKIAFSSALARSTKLAVLENRLNHYFATTRDIPHMLSRGKRPRVTRRFILRKTGELLHLRAQLNLYSELTDALPDLFWDSPHELGLETYYEQAGRALDVRSRIHVLNEKINYASEIATVLREQLSERHGHYLEWIIIWLIMVEVIFGVWHIYVEYREWKDPRANEKLFKEWLERELDKRAAE